LRVLVIRQTQHVRPLETKIFGRENMNIEFDI
jgi:hypothetical protein